MALFYGFVTLVCALMTALSPAPCQAGDTEVIYQTWNRSSCQFSKYSRFELKKPTKLESLRMWYYWQRGETKTSFSVLDSERKALYSGEFIKGQCDPFQHRWCHGNANVDLALAAGVYAVEVPQGRICQNQQSQGQGFIQVRAAAAAQPAPPADQATGQDEGQAQPPGASGSDRVEILDPASHNYPSRGGEIWVLLKFPDGAFIMWVTGGRELQSYFTPAGTPGTKGWPRSDFFKDYVVTLRGYQKKLAAMPADKNGTAELLAPAAHGGPADENWVRLTNPDGSFHLWITGGRQMHCLHKPQGAADTQGWEASQSFPGYVVKCNQYKRLDLAGVGQPPARAEAAPSPQAAPKQAPRGESAAQGLIDQGVKYYYGRGVPKDYKKAFGLFKQAADMGYYKGQRNLGIMYEKGQGVAKDHAQAVQWHRKAAEQGSKISQRNLGKYYKNGDGVPQDYAQAVKWFEKAAQQGDSSAQFYMGVMCERGWGTAKDLPAAAAWYRKAALQGHQDAQQNLGFAYYYGRGVAKDHAQAVEWLRRAAYKGLPKAQLLLGYCLDHGLGVAKNRPEAQRWFQKCAEQGNQNCMKNVKVLEKAGIQAAAGPLPKLKPLPKTESVAQNTEPPAKPVARPDWPARPTTKPAKPKPETTAPKTKPAPPPIQGPAGLPARFYGGSGYDAAHALLATADGGYLLAGASTSKDIPHAPNHGGGDFLVVKTDAQGNVQWQRMLGGAGEYEAAYAAAPTPDGGYIIAGGSDSRNIPGLSNHGEEDIYVVKLDAQGKTQWQKLYGGSGGDWVSAVIPALGGGYILAGRTRSKDLPGVKFDSPEAMYVFKINEQGGLVWQSASSIKPRQEASASSVVAGPDYYLAAGVVASRNFNGAVAKLDTKGRFLAQKHYGDKRTDQLEGAVAGPDGGCLAAGYSNSFELKGGAKGHGHYDFLLMALDRDAKLLWMKLYGGGEKDQAHAVCTSPDGGVVMAGETRSKDILGAKNYGGQDVYLVRTDAQGGLVWQRVYGGSKDDLATAIVPAHGGGYAVAGVSKSPKGQKRGGFFLLLTDDQGKPK